MVVHTVRSGYIIVLNPRFYVPVGCDKVFTLFPELEDHVQNHTNRYYVCSRRQCRQIFFSQDDLKKHMHAHYIPLDGGPHMHSHLKSNEFAQS